MAALQRRRGPIALMVALAALIVAGYWLFDRSRLPVSEPIDITGTAQPSTLEAAVDDFDPDQIVTVTGKDSIGSIDAPVFEPAASVGLRANDPVIGIDVNGDARAYPTRVLSAHEIVNDVVGGRPLAVTW